MARFEDQWVVDKCMFDYVSGGACACCGFTHLFTPTGGFEGMVNTMTDLETDAARHEINAAKASPWPPDMRDQIWSDRLLLRFRMKKGMKNYRSFLEGILKEETDSDEVNIKDAIPILQHFCKNELTPKEIRGIFQLPRSELTEDLKSKYKICSAYAVVFCTVVISCALLPLVTLHPQPMPIVDTVSLTSLSFSLRYQVEQVANFKATRYPVDARSGSEDDNYEERFEKDLKFEKLGPGFCLKITTGGDDNSEVDEGVLLMFLERMVSLAGPTLLARAPKASQGDGDSDDDGEVDGASEKNESNVTSFRSDRRVARLLIARHWADRLIQKYNEVKKKKDEEQTIENTDTQH